MVDEGCSILNPNLTSCAEDRGGIFQSNESSTWSTERLDNGQDGAVYNLNNYVEAFVGLEGNGRYGFDRVCLSGIEVGHPTLEDQIIAGIAENDFWLGSLGISPHSFNFSAMNDPQRSVMGTLRNRSLVPSASWGYTAGASYHDPPVFGSLTLGGYDETRMDRNNVTFAFGADISLDLLVNLRSITYDTVGSAPLLANGIEIFIDSLVSQIWLPLEACRAFEQQFKLTWNDTSELYLLSNESHANLLAQNPVFTFKIGQSGTSGGPSVDVVLPYAAFDLEVSPPHVNETMRYFPLKRAQNNTQYILGRTFLQEAYVVADYERQNFSVYQAMFPPTSVERVIVPIDPPGTDADDSSGAGEQIGGGAIGGIVVGIIIVIAAVVAGTLLFRRRRRRFIKDVEVHEDRPSGKTAPLDGSFGHSIGEVLSTPIHEVQADHKVEVEVKEQYELATQDLKVTANELGDGYSAQSVFSPGPRGELEARENRLGRSELDRDGERQELEGDGLSPVEMEATVFRYRNWPADKT